MSAKKKVQTQWEFGDLFGDDASPQIWTVTEITREIRSLLEGKWGTICISGEITNLRRQSSGHIYFSIKDARSQLSCVLFRGDARRSKHLLEDGVEIVCEGDLTVYEARGQYQLRVTSVELKGRGALQVAFEKLKQRLQGEGLFDPGRKKPLPEIVQRIGLVTSESGAALRDILHVVRRRQPSLQILLAACRVQGDGASEEIAEAICDLNAWHEGGAGLDLILITRGGGSLEDLWAFNEECVARAVSQSAIPIVSAIGHEIDFSICDFVADVRAATPSAAAEIISEGGFATRAWLLEVEETLERYFQAVLESRRETLKSFIMRLEREHPRRVLLDMEQRADEFEARMLRGFEFRMEQLVNQVKQVKQRWKRALPRLRLKQDYHHLGELSRRLGEGAEGAVSKKSQVLALQEQALAMLSPQATLSRGYSITFAELTGKVVKEEADLKSGDKVRTLLCEGEFVSGVERVGKSTS